MFYFLSKLLDVLLSPYTWGLALLALALPWRRRSVRAWRRRRLLGVVGLGVIVLFSTEPVSNSMLYSLEHATASTYRPDLTYDVVVLLGGVTDERVAAETGQPSYNDNVERLVVTHRLLAEGRARVAIVSGAPVDPSLAEHGEARVLGRQLAEWGIAPERVVLEERARNTRENALYTKAIVDQMGGAPRVVVVTSAFHMRRAVECFNAVGMTVDTLAVDYRAYDAAHGSPTWIPRAGFLATSTSTLREVFGWLVYRAQGYAKPL